MLIKSLNHVEVTSGFNQFTNIVRKFCIEFLNNNNVTVRYSCTVANHSNMRSKVKHFPNINSFTIENVCSLFVGSPVEVDSDYIYRIRHNMTLLTRFLIKIVPNIITS